MFFTNAEPLSDCVRLPDIAAPGTVPHAAQTGRYALSPATCCSFFSLPSRRYYTEIRLCARAISFLRSDPSLFFSLSIAPFLFCPLASFFFIPPSFMYVRFALLLGIDIHIICIRRERERQLLLLNSARRPEVSETQLPYFLPRVLPVNAGEVSRLDWQRKTTHIA